MPQDIMVEQKLFEVQAQNKDYMTYEAYAYIWWYYSCYVKSLLKVTFRLIPLILIKYNL